jgi:DNA-3-methyladenine glycosylase
VEAYIGRNDLASHARSGPTRKNATMFGPPGRAYVYLVYGMYHCLNVVTEPENRPAAVLIRAVEPLAGIEEMRLARRERLAAGATGRGGSEATPGSAAAPRPSDARLASGPGLVCVAFSITRADDGADLCDPASELRLELPPEGEDAGGDAGENLIVATGPRIGIDYAPEPWLSNPWRFFVPDSPSLSGRHRARPVLGNRR